jgi:hypothetical protein
MKKMMLTLAIAVSTLIAFAGEVEVNPKVLNAFNNEFKTAKEVEWSVGTDYFRATFTYNDKHVYAYYDVNGELLGLSRFISPNDLPLALQSNLKKTYGDYWISDLFEVANNEGTTYYVTVEDADAKIVLKATDGKSWDSHKKIRKS